MKTLAAALMLMVSATASGQVLKCVRPDGSIEFASVCPPGSTVQQTGIRNNPSASPAPTGAKSAAELDAEFRKRQAKAKESETKAQEEAARDAQKKAQCESAQAYLKNLRAGNRIVKFDPKTGERYFPDEAQYAKELAAAEATAAANCK